MKYYSTNGKAPIATLEKAVVKGLAEDKGLYMPERIKTLPQEFFDNIQNLSFQEIAYTVADAFFGEDVPAEDLKKIVYDTLAFDCPCVKVTDSIYSLELFHGPTLAFKDVGARFMARLLQYYTRKASGRVKIVWSMFWWPLRAIQVVLWLMASWEWMASMCMCSIQKAR